MEKQAEDDSLQTKDRGLEQILLSQPLEGNGSTNTLISDVSPAEPWDFRFPLLRPRSLRYFVAAALGH